MRMRFGSTVLLLPSLVLSGLFVPTANASIVLSNYSETALDFTATYTFTDDGNFQSTSNMIGNDWTANLTETYAPATLNTAASYTLTWVGQHIVGPHAGDVSTGFPGADFCTFNQSSAAAQPCNQSVSLIHMSTILPGPFHTDDFSFILDRDTSGNGTITFSGTHVEPVPLPSALWLFGSGIVALFDVARRRRRV